MAEDSRPVPDPTVLTTEALHREIRHLDELMATKLAAAEALTAERFRGMELLVQLVENRRVEQKKDTSAAVDNALAAAKEAVSKESVSVTNELSALRRELGDVKERVGAVEAQKVGAREGQGGVYAAAGFVLVLLSVAAVVVAFVAGGA
jgi:hypothetical protein